MTSTAEMMAMFAHDPIAPASAAFPLGRVGEGDASGVPSAPEIRPWGLRGMYPARHQGDRTRTAFHYDHRSQTALDATGRTLLAAEPTAHKVTDKDGDEGPSEDFVHDYCPDDPYQV